MGPVRARRLHMLNLEWWTLPRLIVVGATGFFLFITGSFAAIDLINSRCIQPDFEKRATIWYDPIRKADSSREAATKFQTSMKLMKVDNGLEVLLNEEEKAVRDVGFKRDSIRYVQGLRGE